MPSLMTTSSSLPSAHRQKRQKLAHIGAENATRGLPTPDQTAAVAELLVHGNVLQPPHTPSSRGCRCSDNPRQALLSIPHSLPAPHIYTSPNPSGRRPVTSFPGVTGWGEYTSVDGHKYFYRAAYTLTDAVIEGEEAIPALLANMRRDAQREHRKAGKEKDRGASCSSLEALNTSPQISDSPTVDHTKAKLPSEEPEQFLIHHGGTAEESAYQCLYLYLGRAELWVYSLDVSEQRPQSEFWAALAMYNLHYTSVPPNIERQYVCAIGYGAFEQAISNDDALLPYSEVEWSRTWSVYNDLREMYATPQGYVYAPPLIRHMAEKMRDISKIRERTGYGTTLAITSRSERAKYRPSSDVLDTAVRMLAAVVFSGLHETYLERLLEASLMDELSCEKDFRALVGSLLDEWSGNNLLTAVFLAADVAFLSISGIGQLPTILTIASVFFALIGLGTGIHHSWQHRIRVNASYPEILQYLLHDTFFESRHTNLVISASFLAVPTVSLLWAMICIVAALLTFTVQVLGGASAVVMLALVGTVILAMVSSAFVLRPGEEGRGNGEIRKEGQGAGRVRRMLLWLRRLVWLGGGSQAVDIPLQSVGGGL